MCVCRLNLERLEKSLKTGLLSRGNPLMLFPLMTSLMFAVSIILCLRSSSTNCASCLYRLYRLFREVGGDKASRDGAVMKTSLGGTDKLDAYKGHFRGAMRSLSSKPRLPMRPRLPNARFRFALVSTFVLRVFRLHRYRGLRATMENVSGIRGRPSGIRQLSSCLSNSSMGSERQSDTPYSRSDSRSRTVSSNAPMIS